MNSIWNDTVRLPGFEHQRVDVHTDVLIVGGGMAGILCCYLLNEAGVNTVLIEADRLCSGVTGSTTAKITSQHGLIYHKLLRRFGEEKAKLYLQSQQEALGEYRRLCRHIVCDFQDKDAFVYSQNDREKLEEELDALEKLGFEADLAESLPLPFSTVGAVRFPNQAQFHPLSFLSSIVPGLPIYEHTKLLELLPGRAVTNRGLIRAEKIIMATHFPILNKHGSYFLKLYQSRSYVLALKRAPELKGMYLDEKENGLSFRNYRDMLLLGGGGHRTGKQGGGWQGLSQDARRFYPQSWEAARWATQDCMSLDGVPYIGQYSPRTPNLYVATGFGKWGMTNSMAAAAVLRDMVMGICSPYEDLYNPSRSLLRPQLAVNGFTAVTNLLTPTAPRCPHMGCALKWNKQEHTWDCPCHGSRFEKSGKLLDGPATDDKNL